MWTNDVVLRLIDLFRSYECLWNTANNDYKNLYKKRAIWEEISQKMNLPREVTETKIRSLRSQFIRERKKVHASKKAGSGTEDAKQSNWFAYESLMFLIKEDTTSGAMDALLESALKYNAAMGSEFPMKRRHFTPQIRLKHRLGESMELTNKQDSQSSSTSEFEKNDGLVDSLQLENIHDDQAAKLDNKSRKRTSEDNINESRKITTDAKKKMNKHIMVRDEFDIYAEYVASELRNIKSEEEVIMAKSFINDVLLEARLRSISQSATNSRMPHCDDDDDDEDHATVSLPDSAQQDENSRYQKIKVESLE